ncbi:uncharacterized protein LOC106174620 [Lingula anatina]|uniref:Uncharacterized protein LOC106174620 n=1 Tax=Lingula anatina TaxID=7574 RepID=A0A1S3JP12_LINAN|nr:uncharacterized protein LOC106174620 [Lingula anatina]|eukprot:XP_013411734.1 uncharacterized protein LOC106174620 [Lingula anatina]
MASIGSKPFAKRPLGCIEYLLARCSISGMSTALAYTWHLESNSPVTVDLVHQAAALLQDTMPLLRLHVISGEDGRYYFEVMDSTACSVPFKISSETDWRKAQDEMLKETYNLETGPLWKMCFLPTDCKEPAPREISRGRSLYKCAVTFGIDHILTDGFTNMTICKQFLKILNEIMDGRQPDKTPATKVYPSLVDLMPKNDMVFGWFDYLAIGKTVWDMMFIKPNILALHYPLIDALPLQTFNVYTDGLSEVETTQLRKRCKAQLTTIHGAFTAAASTATAWMIYGRDKPQGNVRVRYKSDCFYLNETEVDSSE